MEVNEIISYLKSYDGSELKLMEICGTHTASIFKNGIRDLISPKIKLISGPGCPVCVTPSAYIDKCIEYAKKDDHSLLTFGDMMKVQGTEGSLSDMKSEGASVELMYSPFEAIEKAREHPEHTYVIGAVGFETTVPSYALLAEQAAAMDIENIKMVTALKAIIPALQWICENETDIDGFICPGHVSVVIGCRIYEEMASKYNKPFVVAGFEAEHLLAAIYDIVRQTECGRGEVRNLYKTVVKDDGNIRAKGVISRCFETNDAFWRGLGKIEHSGLFLKAELKKYDGGSLGLDTDVELPDGCKCGSVITGRINPDECPMFGTKCDPLKPFGPCMVSAEGACGIWYRNKSR